jgi:hypothetical protein
MTVAEVIAVLQQLPQDADAKFTWNEASGAVFVAPWGYLGPEIMVREPDAAVAEP